MRLPWTSRAERAAPAAAAATDGALDEIDLGRRRRLPLVLAAETAECGLACLAMIARYWGHDVDLMGLRQRYALSRAGANLRAIMSIAGDLGFATRALRVDLSSLSRVRVPAILHWNLDHLVVLKAVRRKSIVVLDPSKGRCTYTREQFSKHFTGVVLELTPIATFTKIVAQTPVRLTSLWSRMQGFWTALGEVLVASVALQVLTFAAPLQVQLVVDDVIFHNDDALLTVIALAFAAVALLRAAAEWVRSWTLQAFGQLLSFQMTGNLFHHLLRLPTSYFEKRSVGDVLSRMGSTMPIREALTQGVAATLIDGAMALAVGVILFAYSPVLASVVVLFLVLVGFSTAAFYPFIRARLMEQIVASANEQSHLIETLRAAATVKIMGVEAQRESRWRNLFAGSINAAFAASKLEIASTATREALSGLQMVIVLYLAARMIMAGDGFSIGMLFAFMSYRQTLTDRVTALAVQGVQFRLLKLHLERIADIVHTEPECANEASVPITAEGKLSLRDVSFRYGAGDRWILDKVNLEVEPGDFVAITGPTGCGKSTLLKLMLGLHAPNEGEIFLEGQPATPAMWRGWRSQIGVVSQNDQLLTGTIAENIAFFDPALDIERVHRAAAWAQVHDEILAFPMRYLSRVGDMGAALSAGQRQRVLLARALYREPRVLFLDECTANLDEATEAMVADVIAKLPITRVVIAHRPSLVRLAHRVYAMEGGGLRLLSADGGRVAHVVGRDVGEAAAGQTPHAVARR